ncbi:MULTISPECIES: thioesterase II family protein [Streptomyces]|uniref:thioesterase II family protein n=1 Tax=Streptomyces TaxID=1883 RepID=UPI00200CA8E2|nr:alpha/beta fold hydrolase [Streptomyces sp. LRE541]UPZ27771.1 alpha/beta fold hydrolase [Streptomyces sp. LRE541]
MTHSLVDSNAWVRRFRPAPDAGARLVCFPHAGGAASFYFPVARALHPRVDVLAVQYPGRQERRSEAPLTDIGTLADLSFAALRPVLTGRPVLFGHSMGAVVAFEVARRMEREDGVSPAALVVSGRRAPSCRREEESVHLRTDEGVIAELKRLNGTDNSLLDDEELVRMFLPPLRADYRAVETYAYAPGPPLGCPVTVFTGDRDPQVTMDEALAWREHTTGAFDLEVFEGGHFYLSSDPATTLDRLESVLRAHGTGPAAS